MRSVFLFTLLLLLVLAAAPAAAQPSATPDTGLRPAAAVQGPLEREAVLSALGRLQRQLERCLGPTPDADGAAAFVLVVAENGRPTSVTTTVEGWTTPRTRRCFERTLIRARFARRDAPSRISITYWIGEGMPSVLDGASSGGLLGALRGSQPRSSSLGGVGLGAGGGGSGAGGLGRRAGGDTGMLGGRGSGPGRARPPAGGQVTHGDVAVRGSLSRQVIQRVIRQNLNAVRYCYESELVRTPGLAGRLTVRFVISPTGAVQSVAATTSTLGSSPMEGCVVRQVRRWRFPEPAGGGIVIVDYPFVFRTPDAAPPAEANP